MGGTELAVGAVALAAAEGIVGSLAASGILKAGRLWGFTERQLKKRIAEESTKA